MLSSVSERLVPQLLQLLPSQNDTSRAHVLDILRNICLGYQHSPHVLLDNRAAFLSTLAALQPSTSAVALAQIIQCMLYLHDRLPSKAPTFASLVRYDVRRKEVAHSLAYECV